MPDTISSSSWTAPEIVVVPLDDCDTKIAQAIAETLNLTVTPNPVAGRKRDNQTSRHRGLSERQCPTQTVATRWQLKVSENTRTLVRPDGVSLAINFASGRASTRAAEPDFHRQPLSKALGVATLLKSIGRAPLVLDATAGFGQDAWLMANLGCDVVMVEQSALLCHLLDHALLLATDTSEHGNIVRKLTLVEADSTEWMKHHPQSVDVVYLDPMYPQRRKSAKVKKAMQFLHVLIGPNNNDHQWLQAALSCATHRVVVKRPSGASPLLGTELFDGQITHIESPNTRYDVYHLHP
ncbi:MAG: class I SAM-dependent methyltransferase [Gammaproteobacteria bacterium]|nr:class I SAM-dependent methyltransferase [Gammaproteobacteria bacterium]